jgi:hypothetical protein
VESEYFSPYVQIHNAVSADVAPVDYAPNRFEADNEFQGHCKRTERYRTKLFLNLTMKWCPFDGHELNTSVILKGDHISLRSHVGGTMEGPKS